MARYTYNALQDLLERSDCCRSAGMDNVRNMTGSPIAGLDPHEFVDSRPLCKGGHPFHPPHSPHPCSLHAVFCLTNTGRMIKGSLMHGPQASIFCDYTLHGLPWTA
jgi:hypothetical protein